MTGPSLRSPSAPLAPVFVPIARARRQRCTPSEDRREPATRPSFPCASIATVEELKSRNSASCGTSARAGDTGGRQRSDRGKRLATCTANAQDSSTTADYLYNKHGIVVRAVLMTHWLPTVLLRLQCRTGSKGGNAPCCLPGRVGFDSCAGPPVPSTVGVSPGCGVPQDRMSRRFPASCRRRTL